MAQEAKWSWSDTMDALIAAPKHHRLLFENELVRVLETSVPPGETVPIHTHRWPSILYVLSMDDFIRRDEAGRVVVDSRLIKPAAESSPAVWSAALPPHTLENIGRREIRCINVELKNDPLLRDASRG